MVQRPRQTSSQIASQVLGCLGALVLAGLVAVMGLVALSAVLWAWRTVFGA